MRVDALDKPGGDLFTVQEFIKAGRNPGPGGFAIFDGELITDLQADFSGFDLVHLTNIDRPVDTYHSYRAARAAGRPVVITTIHHSYREIARYEREGRGGAIGLVSGTLGYSGLEYLRSIVRSARYPQLLVPTIVLATHGMREAQAAVLSGARLVMVLTEKERNDIIADIGDVPAAACVLLRNGFEGDLTSSASGGDASRDIDVCVVGRIEARKNQIKILNALDDLGISGTFAGGENKNHRRYCEEFKRRIASSRSVYLGGAPHDEIVRIMRRARVHVSASWFEVSSLVDIEAYLCGCRVVSSRCGGTHEILRGRAAEYVDPGSLEDIQRGILAALARSGNTDAENIDYGIVESWASIGRKLAVVYHEAIAGAQRA
ncbi:MAG: glycosyltransferase [Acidobacteriaceae bacterium]|jgi:glycosyltransferase involved in cell wall biosynthesis